MELLGNSELDESGIVANCRMNRERELIGANGYARELRFNPLDFLRNIANSSTTARWLDLCCGSGKALSVAAEMVDSEELPVEIVGVDLVAVSHPPNLNCLSFVRASLSDWQPSESFHLITCVHGLHYIGDKLGLISRAASWLTEHGRFAGNMDMNNIELQGGVTSRIVPAKLRENNFEYSFRTKLIQRNGRHETTLPFRYLGADDHAGPNYTGQPAVNSHYEMIAVR